MTKPFKLHLHLPSFQICRSKKSSTLAKSPLPATHMFTPVNPKAFDITYPKSPSPPPSTPNHPLCKRNFSSKLLSVGSEAIVSSSFNLDSPGYGQNRALQKLYNSPDISNEFDQTVWPLASLNAEKNDKEGNHWVNDQSATSFSMSISSADSACWSSSEDGNEPDDESEGLLSSCSSLESSCDFGHPAKTLSNQKPTYENLTKRKKRNGKVRRLKHYASNSWKDGEKIKLATSTMLPLENVSRAKKTVLGRLLPCAADGKVKESYAIMKKSADPFDDFKISMLEMIIEKQMSEPEDLEKLLMCFLSLNSKEHHGVIVAAFTEVWEELFSSDSKPPNSSG